VRNGRESRCCWQLPIRSFASWTIRPIACSPGSDSRAGITADWNRVFEEAAARGVAIEIDDDPARQDLDYQLADRAREASYLLALGSDAHVSQAFIYTDTAIAHARLAGIPASWVLTAGICRGCSVGWMITDG
jgi:histidinol phosphatase-like PHP family hydrolase